MNRLEYLDAVASYAHAGQIDKAGVDYIEHPRAVAGMVSARAKPVALLHDVLEDTDLKPQDLRPLLSQAELDAVLLLTRRPDETYRQFTERVATATGEAGDLAREVKVADIRHNLSRMTPALAGLKKRYGRALARLGASV